LRDEAIYRDRFVVSDPSIIYLDGNSLGRLPQRTAELVPQILQQQWGSELIGSWNKHWLALSTRIGDKIGTIIGAPAGTTIVCDSTSVNLYKLAKGLLHRDRSRQVILTDRSNFPTNQYILQGLAVDAFQDGELRRICLDHVPPEYAIDRLADALSDDVGLVSLSHVHYKSGMALDLARITRLVQDRGAAMLWDVSHSVGAIPIDIEKSGAYGAVGCTYKYLNGGPGAPAFLYIRSDLQDVVCNPIQGWFGAARPFDFGEDYSPATGVQRFLVGTPPILSMAAIEPGVDLVLEAGISWLRSRSLGMTEYLIEKYDARLLPRGYRLQTPRDPIYRGSHVSLQHEHAWPITQALIHEHRVIPDFRQPDTIRFGITPLYTTYDELDRAVDALVNVLEQRQHLHYPRERQGVT
jgi:kynureninase